MPALSVHEDVIAKVATRVQALNLGNFVQREVLVGAWGTGLPDFPRVILSGFGLLRNMHLEDSCNFTIAYPFAVVYEHKKQQWSPDDVAAGQAAVQAILDAFIQKPLGLSYSGASCYNVEFIDGPTMQNVDEAWQTVARQLNFEAWVKQRRT